MSARSKAKKKSRRSSKKGAGRKTAAALSTPKYSFEQMAYVFFVAFGQGAKLPIKHPDVVDEAKNHFTSILTTSINDGTFDNDAMVEETKLCAMHCGEIASSLAMFKKHTQISKSDFIAAYQLLEQETGGGSGGLC